MSNLMLSLVNENWSLIFGAVFRLKISAKNIYCAGVRMDGDQKCPSIFRFFKYVNK